MVESDIFLSVYKKTDEEAVVPFHTAICLFLLKYLHFPEQLSVTLVLDDNNDNHNLQPNVSVTLKGFTYKICVENDLKRPIKDCHLPVFAKNDGISSCVAGLCAVLRQIIKCSGEKWKWLLGFREGCLAACAEVSLWTRFCEVDVINMVDNLLSDCDNRLSVNDDDIEIPIDVVRFEEHLNQSVRVHNIKKVLQNKNKEILDHSFAESHQMSLADLIIFPCFYIVLNSIGNNSLKSIVPLVYKWFNLLLEQDNILESTKIFNLPSNILSEFDLSYTKPEVPAQSLYKSDPKRYKPKWRLFTKQEEVEEILVVLNNTLMPMDYSSVPFGHEHNIDWSDLPNGVQPDVPNSRLNRKIQQLENLAKAVLKIAKPGDIIVDFCSGSGHLGILVAYSLPQCHIILLDNKEESLLRAYQRVKDLQLNNISIIQCNLDYFTGDFQIGMSLHACGVASDLVIQTCLQKNAAFVVCPCCYGSLQDNHKINYPQSRCLQKQSITKRNFFVLGHCADQVHKQLYKKSEQGERCMAIVDFDRCLQAKENGYDVSLAKLIPPSCTPRNNLLVGTRNVLI